MGIELKINELNCGSCRKPLPIHVFDISENSKTDKLLEKTCRNCSTKNFIQITSIIYGIERVNGVII